MLNFLIDHYDWLIAAVAGHFSLSGAGSIGSWVKAEYAKFSALGAALKAQAAPAVKAVEAAVVVPAAPQPPK